MRKNIFEPLNFFMLRVPHLPIEYFKKVSNDSDFLTSLQQISKEKNIDEAISVASTTLKDSLSNLYLEKGSKKNKQITSSFFKYISRMSTRATPFGLFAGVTTGNIAEKTEVILNQKEYFKKRTRADMGWLLGMVYKLESNPIIYKQLTLQTNNAIKYRGNRIILPFVSACGQVENREKDQLETVSIQGAEPINKALEFANKPIKYDKLLYELIKEYPQANQSQIEGMVSGLFKKEYLISELRPPLTNSKPLDYILTKLDRLHDADQERLILNNIKNKINQYDTLSLGEGTSFYLDLVNEMKEINNVKNPLQVDMSISTQKATINSNVGKEVAEAAECLLRLSTFDKESTPLNEYRKEFLERYGYAREIPILDLLDEEEGLGSPATYKYPESNRREKPRYNTRERDTILMNLVQKSLLDKQLEISLTDKLINQLSLTNLHPNNTPESMEIYTEIISPSPESIDQGDFKVILGNIIGSNGIGKTFGRFLDFMGEDTKEHINNFFTEQENRSSAIYAEISYLPRYGRSANVGLIEGLRKYEISLGTNNSIDTKKVTLNDILVGATRDRFYLKSKKLNKEIIVTTGHMLNSKTFPNVYRFMREISAQNEQQFEPFQWGALKASTFLPRMRYKRTILSPAQWKLRLIDLNINKKTTINEFFLEFTTWVRNWLVPRYVYLTIADNRILLDTHKVEHVEEIFKKLTSSSNEVKLHEFIGDFNDRWIQNSDGNYTMECVFPLVSNFLEEKTSYSLPSRKFRNDMLDRERYKKVGSDWLYINFYLGMNSQDDFIIKELQPLCNSLVNEGLCNKWFFMRYKDPEDHLRVRFQGNPQKLMSQVLPILIDWEKHLVTGMLKRMTIDCYVREIERYGGPLTIEEAESVFYKDSLTTSQLLSLLKLKSTKLPNYVLCSLSVIHLLKHLGWDFEKQHNYLSQITNKNDYKKEFREWRNKYLSWLNTGDEKNPIVLTDEYGGDRILSVLNLRNQQLEVFGNTIDDLNNKDELWNTKPEIINSLIHLHCNRLAGIDRDFEIKSVTLARHALDSSIKYATHMNKKHEVLF